MNGILAPASEAARAAAEIAWWLFGGGALVFAGVVALAAIGWRKRARIVRPAAWLVGGGIAFPAVVLTALLLYSEARIDGLMEPDIGDSPVVGITGHMWWWEIHYRDPDSGRPLVSANELRIPVGTPVVIGVSSDDVIHSFWVPELGGKIDLVPGRTGQAKISADRPGVYRGQCAEFCGEQHTRMALHVVAMPRDDYVAWLRSQADASAEVQSPELLRGRQAFVDLRCGVCHVVRGLSEDGVLGPDLTHVGGRLHLAAGTLPLTRESLRDWIADPQRFKPGARMPSYGHVDRHTLDALAAWVEQLR